MKKKIAIVGQHINGIGFLEQSCIQSYKKIFSPEQYDYYDYVIDRKEGESFCGSLGKICTELSNYEYIGLYFDDLNFESTTIIEASKIEQLFGDHELDYLRWNAYPPGDFTLKDNPSFSLIDTESPYVFSLVASFFKRSVLEDLCRNRGLNSAWDIEKFKPERSTRALCFNGKPLKYHNLIVKGHVDGLAVIQSQVSLKLRKSVFLKFLDLILITAHKHRLLYNLLKRFQKSKVKRKNVF